jgi:DNA-directed RNA polymerase subunit D
MKIDVVESNDKVLRFKLTGATNWHANTLRRIAINNVKAFAIDRATFYENTGAMFDEYIAHRLGLIPILTPNKGYDEKDEVLFTLEAVGPKVVYSKELESADKEVKIANGNIPIIKLAAEQRLRLECKAVMGTGLKHAKFQPGMVTYDSPEQGTYNFYVESFGQMPPKEIINKAFEVIREEIKDVSKEVKKL